MNIVKKNGGYGMLFQMLKLSVQMLQGLAGA